MVRTIRKSCLILISLLILQAFVSSSTLAAEVELASCDHFLKTKKEVCLFHFKKMHFGLVREKLNFKTKNHEGAFWLGFSISNLLDCPNYMRASGNKNSGSPEDIFRSYFLGNIDISKGVASVGKDLPFALSYFSGESFYYFTIDNFGQEVACKIMIQTAGPGGQFGNWIRIINR